MKWRKLLSLLLAMSLTVVSNCVWAAGMERNDDDMKNERVVQTAGRDALGEFAPEFAHYNDDVLFSEN